MKKIIILTACIMAVLPFFAQDIIVTTADQKIEAKITEVSKTEIKYKEKDNPTFILSTDEISSIIYSNGQVKTYIHASQQPEKQATAATEKTSASAAKPTGGRIYRDGKEYMYNDTYISAKQVARILQREDKAAYSRWKKADGLVVAGSVFTGIGCGLAIGSIFPMISKRYPTTIGLDCAALVSLGVGVGLICGAVAHYEKAVDLYNSKYDRAAVQLRYSIGTDGLGLAFAF